MSLELKTKPTQHEATQATHAPLYLLDGHSLTFKAYYGVRGLTAPDGQPTGAVFGFLRMLLKLIDDLDPQYLAVVFDTGKPTFRHEIFDQYKANREAPPPDFSDQMQWIYRLLKAMRIRMLELDGYEADDLIATLASETSRSGGRAVIVSADKDLFQLVDGRTKMLRFGQNDLEDYDEAAVLDKMGVKPAQIPDWLALVGDSSDNIPGVPTIGAKGAAKLLSQFESLEDIIAHADEITPERQKRSLRENMEQARLSLRLATVVRDVPIGWSLDECKLPKALWTPEVVEVLTGLGFDSILKEKGLEATGEEPSRADGPPAQYAIVYEAQDLRKWVDRAVKSPWIAIDTETTGIDPMQAELVGMSLSCTRGEAIYIPMGHRVGSRVEDQLPIGRVREILAPILSPVDPRAGGLAAHHAKYDWKILERAGFALAPPTFDTMVASFVLDPGRVGGHGLKSLGAEFAGVRMQPIVDIIGTGKNAVTVAEVTPEAIADYAAQDADVTLRLTEFFSKALKESKTLDRLFHRIEMPLIPVLHRMEMGGVHVDPSHLETLSDTMTGEIARLEKEIWSLAGREFNIASPKQLSRLLFEELELTKGKKTKTGFSTDNSVLERLAPKHEIARLVLEYRALVKLKSTYADTLPRQVNPGTRRIHTSFQQTIAQTGRLSSTAPNLQNIPIRTRLGREIRRSFIPDASDHRLLGADYSQIELRILAHLSADASLREAYAEGRDIHALTASRLYGVEEADVTPEMRSKAKVVNFGIIYGMSAFGLSQRLQIPRGEAAQFIDAYFAGYPGVKNWIEQTLETARKTGWVETLMGRRRHVPNLTAKNGQLRANAERVAINSPIQGASADMIKLAMIEIDQGLEERAPGARMLLQVHDELIFSIPQDQIDPASEFIVEAMREAMALDVPVVVDVAVGRNWAEL